MVCPFDRVVGGPLSTGVEPKRGVVRQAPRCPQPDGRLYSETRSNSKDRQSQFNRDVKRLARTKNSQAAPVQRVSVVAVAIAEQGSKQDQNSGRNRR